MVKAATKICITCHASKPVALFAKQGNQCKTCIAAKKREYYQNNKAKKREYYQNNKAKKREYYQNNKVEIGDKNREYKQNNKEKIAAYIRKYRQEHKAEIAVKRREYRNARYHSDPDFNLICRLRCRMNNAVKAAGLDKKYDSTSELLGISYQGLKEWLEAQFSEGMTWENRSDWHIDHRVPCTAFDMTVPEQQRICFWYKNLQPLWAKDNIQKSNTYTEEEKQALISAYCNQ